MRACFVWSKRKRVFQTKNSGHADQLFYRNTLIITYEFTMEKLLFVLRSQKGRLVINLESLLLHEKEELRQLLWKEEVRQRSRMSCVSIKALMKAHLQALKRPSINTIAVAFSVCSKQEGTFVFLIKWLVVCFSMCSWISVKMFLQVVLLLNSITEENESKFFLWVVSCKMMLANWWVRLPLQLIQ